MRPTFEQPCAITMWDFSWLERRWPGAGYEDWDVALSELAERGYDAVRIDAYPHLLAADPHRVWELLPVWSQMTWGAQSITHVTVLPALLDFLRAARRHGVGVALSSWFREDRDNTRMRIRTAADQGAVWVETLRLIEGAGLLDTILYVDLCNEFPMLEWAPYYYSDDILGRAVRGAITGGSEVDLTLPPMASRVGSRFATWMTEAIDVVRSVYPELDYTFSFTGEYATWAQQDVSALDVLEPHVWMAGAEDSPYYDRVGYGWERFEPTGFDNLVLHGRREYERGQVDYDAALFREIDRVADWSRATGLGLYTTECWAVVDYKDWPGLEWDWVLDLNARAVEHVVATGRWVGVATSNFCGPQFVGMWREVAWHQRLTTLIKQAPIDADIRAPRQP